jgi:hypothetical protein
VHVKAIYSVEVSLPELKCEGAVEQGAKPVCTPADRAHPLVPRNVSITDMICIEEHLPNP